MSRATSPSGADVSAVPHPSAPAGIPVLELQRRLGVVHDYYAGLVEFYVTMAYAPQADPIGMCQITANLADQLDGLRIACEQAQAHCLLLFDLSLDERRRRESG